MAAEPDTPMRENTLPQMNMLSINTTHALKIKTSAITLEEKKLMNKQSYSESTSPEVYNKVVRVTLVIVDLQ